MGQDIQRVAGSERVHPCDHCQTFGDCFFAARSDTGCPLAERARLLCADCQRNGGITNSVAMETAGYLVEPSLADPDTTVVIYLPVEGPDIRPEHEVSLWEKASLASTCQRMWSDNAVSVTLTFQTAEKSQIGAVLRAFDGQMKSVSFLPMAEGVYPQAPYQRVPKWEWDLLRAKIKPLDWDALYGNPELPDAEGELYCTTDTCEIPR